MLKRLFSLKSPHYSNQNAEQYVKGNSGTFEQYAFLLRRILSFYLFNCPSFYRLILFLIKYHRFLLKILSNLQKKKKKFIS